MKFVIVLVALAIAVALTEAAPSVDVSEQQLSELAETLDQVLCGPADDSPQPAAQKGEKKEKSEKKPKKDKKGKKGKSTTPAPE